MDVSWLGAPPEQVVPLVGCGVSLVLLSRLKSSRRGGLVWYRGAEVGCAVREIDHALAYMY